MALCRESPKGGKIDSTLDEAPDTGILTAPACNISDSLLVCHITNFDRTRYLYEYWKNFRF